MEGRVLVDTSAWIDALRKDGDREVRAAVHAVMAEGTAVLCDMVRVELCNGARGRAEQAMLRELDKELECVTTSPHVWEAAVELARACRRKGVTLPATDLLIAACADYHSLGLLHHDRHFDEIARAR